MPARAGRPKRSVPPTRVQLTRRVRLLVDEAHDGNLAEAARATGLSYPTVRGLYLGQVTNPSLRTLETLAGPYGVELDWLTAEGAAGSRPPAGVVGLLPPHPSTPQQRHGLRRVLIPVRAWPMYDVFRRLTRWLEGEPPLANRPIVHEGTGESFTFRLTTFLLQPLLAAEKLGEPEVIPFEDDAAPEIPPGPVGEHWVAQLRQLGAMWQVVLEDVLDR